MWEVIMRDLSITQEYLICTLNKKGALPSTNPKASVCMIIGGLLEMQMEKCISMEDKKVIVSAELPEHMSYLKPLYDVINQKKPMKAQKVVETYYASFTSKKLNMLLDALLDELKSADAVESVKTGLLGSKEAFAPKKEAVISVIEKIRAELLEDGDVSEDVIALTVLLDKSGQLKEYFSKYEQKELKEKLEVIRKSKAGTTAKELLWYIDSLDASIMISTMISSTM